MAINTTTVESNLTTKLNNTSGTTDAKEFLLLGKAVEALQPSVSLSSVQAEGITQVGLVTAEGNTQVAAVQAAGANYATLSGATFTGDVDFGSNKITYANVYSQLSDLPSASTYHGMFAHVHATGKGYYAHGGNWIPLVNSDANGDVVIDGSLTVNGTQTIINSTTLDVDDLNITVAKGAADAAAANNAGLTVDGASATLTYASATDNWNFNKGLAVNGPLNINEIVEKATIDTSTSGTLAVDSTVQAVVFLNTNQTANRTINFSNVNANMAVGESMSFAVLSTQGSSAYYFNAYQVDGSSVTPKWQGGSAPSGGNASGIDVYTFTIIKTASATFTVLASVAQFA
tara:strand:+ start:618 stop:1652 length:1035 start_codon:yes stop_codon:yes gene_type:complete